MNIQIDMDTIEELLSKNGSLRLYPKGNSMLPLIREGTDSVLLVPADQIKPGDIVLVRTDSHMTLHRLVSKVDERIITCGDNCIAPDPVIIENQIIAKVLTIFRGDEIYDDGRPLALLYRLWHTHFFQLNGIFLRIVNQFRYAVGWRYCPCCGNTSHFMISEETAWNETEKKKMMLLKRKCICPVCGSMPLHRVLAWYLTKKEVLKNATKIACIYPFPPFSKWLDKIQVPYYNLPLSVLESDDVVPNELRNPDILFCINRVEDTTNIQKALHRLAALTGPDTLLILSVTHLDFPMLIAARNCKFAILGDGIFQLLKEEGLSYEVLDYSQAPADIDLPPGPAIYDSGLILLCRKQP
jgi:signal peptidase I